VGVKMRRVVYKNAGYGLKKLSDNWLHQPMFRKGGTRPLFGRRKKRNRLF